jgi:hypothetical protein
MLHRGAVIPTLASLGIYLVAVFISIFVLFTEVGYGSVVAPPGYWTSFQLAAHPCHVHDR